MCIKWSKKTLTSWFIPKGRHAKEKTNQSLEVVHLASSTPRRETITNQTNSSIGKSVLPVHLCTIKTSYVIYLIT